MNVTKSKKLKKVSEFLSQVKINEDLIKIKDESLFITRINENSLKSVWNSEVKQSGGLLDMNDEDQEDETQVYNRELGL